MRRDGDSARESSFYAMPTAWGGPDAGYVLAELWRRGGVGAISLVPVLGQYAHCTFSDHLRLPLEKAARLAGIDRQSAARGARALKEMGLACHRLVPFRGQRLTEWALAPGIAAQQEGTGRFGANSYFYLDANLIVGGNWAALSGPQRALYLGLALRAKSMDPQSAKQFLGLTMRPGTPLFDLERCAEHTERPWVRVASVSFADLAEMTGVNPATLRRAARGLKHPKVWPGSSVDPDVLRHAPLSVYPSMAGYELLYHFRDHAPPRLGDGSSDPTAP